LGTNSLLAGAAAIGVIVGAAAAYGNTITFDTAPTGEFDPGTSITEDGFTYSVEPGTTLHVATNGVTGNDVEGFYPAQSSQTGVLQITSATPGGTFSLAGLEIAGITTLFDFRQATAVDITGLLGGSSVGTEDFRIPVTTTYQYTAEDAGTLAGVTIDRLEITLFATSEILPIPPFQEVDVYSAIDNVEVDPSSVSAVPEPASILLFGTGLVGIASIRIRGSV
jgi:hypothetical protein